MIGIDFICLSTFNVSQQSEQIVPGDGLECCADNMAHIFSDRVEKSVYIHNQVWRRQNLRPKQFKVALFQNISQNDDVADLFVFHLLWQQQAFAQHEIGVREVGKRFQQNQICDIQIHQFRIELVRFQYSQIGFQIVCVVLRLLAHIILQCFQVLWVVPMKQCCKVKNV